jgi:hypothetical protein
MTRGKAGHYWPRVFPPGFTPLAVILSGGGTTGEYGIPGGATLMKVWVIGAGGNETFGGSGAGGVAYKTWAGDLSGSVTYKIGDSYSNLPGGSDTLGNRNSFATYGGTTITGVGTTSASGGSYSGGDGGANGGGSYIVQEGEGNRMAVGGAVGGNAGRASCGRETATDVSGLFAAVALAGGTTTESCDASAAFGSGAVWSDSDSSKRRTGGLGGGGNGIPPTPEGGLRGAIGGAVVLYFS